MEENQMQLEPSNVQNFEPSYGDNSKLEQFEEAYPSYSDCEGQSQDPSQELILGKFKSVEELSKAYLELQKHQGENSKELGNLRKDASSMNDLAETLKQALALRDQMAGYLEEYRTKYDQPEYFQDSTFRDIYKEAFLALGENLDTDKFISLLESYVGSRISAHNKSKSATEETQKILDSMTYEKNPKSGFAPPKKSFDEMSPQEIDELLDRLI